MDNTNTTALDMAERMKLMLGASAPVLARIDAALMNVTESKPSFGTMMISNAAKELNLSRPTLYRLIERGRIRTVKLNGVQRVVEDSVRDFIAGRS